MRDRTPKVNARARVSKDEDEPPSAPSCFEMYRSAMSLGNTRARVAPRRSSAMRATWHQPAGVRSDAGRGSLFPGLLFTGKSTTQACCARGMVAALHAECA